MNRVDPSFFFGGGGGGGVGFASYLQNKKIFGQMTHVPRPPIIIKINDSARFFPPIDPALDLVSEWFVLSHGWMKDIFRATLQIK